MLRQTGSKLCIFALIFTSLAVAKPPPSPVGPWASYGKPVFSRSLGPPFANPGISSIAVPYMPKASPFFPKFVDPTTMISKKTDMLSNLFGGLGPVNVAPASGAYPKYPSGFNPSSPFLYATNADETPEAKEVNGVDESVANDKSKRGVLGAKAGASKTSSFNPFAAKFSPFAPKFSPFAPNFSPFAPNFMPMAPGFPFQTYPSEFNPGFYDSDTISTRRRRSIVETEGESTKSLGPPPAYPGLAPIAEEPESLESKLQKLYDPASVPKESLPGMFGPFGPFSPYASNPVNPMTFISKKTTFLDTLFNSLTTPVPYLMDSDLPVTEIPIPKSTIVPPGFWAPSSIIPGPTEYTDKVSIFLDKLFSSLALNKTATAAGTGKTILARSLIEDPAKGKIMISRSLEDIRTIAAVKDSIVDSILLELGNLKTDMINTFNDYILYEKTQTAFTASKKPFKPSPFAAFFAPPTPDPSLPFKQRMILLGQVFDMLTGIQRNITLAVQDAIKSSMDVSDDQEPKILQDYDTAKINDAYNYVVDDPNNAAIAAFNATLVDVIRSRLAALDNAVGNGFNKFNAASIYEAPAKRDVENEDYFNPENYENHQDNNRERYKRSVRMQMHQRYRNMPPGTIESVEVGDGSVPEHRGGGIKFLDSQNNGEHREKWFDWAEYFKNLNEGRKHHHNHH